MGNRRRPKKSITQLPRPTKPLRKNPANPLFSEGKPFYPKVPGQFYVLGETVTKSEHQRSVPVGPFHKVVLTFHHVLGDDKTIAYYDPDTCRWHLGDKYYLHLLIFNGGEDPQTYEIL